MIFTWALTEQHNSNPVGAKLQLLQSLKHAEMTEFPKKYINKKQ